MPWYPHIVMQGLVMKSTGSWYNVLGAEGRVYACRNRGKLRLKGSKTTNPIAVGDRVEFSVEDEKELRGMIEKVMPRHNYIERKSVKKTAQGHMLAANVDQVMLIVTWAYPKTSLGFIDRFLVSAEAFRIPQVLVFNKQDLLNEEALLLQDQMIEPYLKVGIQCLKCTATESLGIQEVEHALQNKITLISGHSGVGKSTLLNQIDPKIDQKIGDVSDFAQKGVHTTTFAEMFRLRENTYVIDTPGIKELGLVDIPTEELPDYFPEIRKLRGECRFHNCTHTQEPGCAIIDAVEAGEIATSRYESYLSMLWSEDNRR